MALAAAQAFGKVWVQAPSGIARQVNVLKRAAFAAKSRTINTIYSSRIRTEDDTFRIPHTALLGVEAFTPATFEEVMHGIALTRSEILPFPDAWGLFSSPYESYRYERILQTPADHVPLDSVKTIAEVGACEGAMTRHLRKAFPRARYGLWKSIPNSCAGCGRASEMTNKLKCCNKTLSRYRSKPISCCWRKSCTT